MNTPTLQSWDDRNESVVAQTLSRIKATTRYILEWRPIRKTSTFWITIPNGRIIPIVEKRIEGKRSKRNFQQEWMMRKKKILVVAVKMGDTVERLMSRLIHLIKATTAQILREEAREARRRETKRHFCIRSCAGAAR